MKKKALGLIVVFLLLSSMACSVLQGAAPDAEPEDQADAAEDIQAEDEEPAQGAAVSVELGEVYESLQGGYSFQQAPGYEVAEFFGMVTMAPPGADQTAGPMITLIGMPNEGALSNEQMLTEMEGGLPAGVTISNPRDVVVDGVNALEMDFEGEQDGVSVAGKVVVAAVSDSQAFNMIAFFPAGSFGDAEEALVDSILATVRFFEPQELEFDWDEEEDDGWSDGSSDGGTYEGDRLRQWAVSAEASTEYGSDSWSAAQTTGAPDTPDCGDYGTSWASDTSYGQDWIELDYATPVVPDEINIYQTYSPNQVVWVEVRDLDGLYTTVYFDAPYVAECPFVMTIPVSDVDFLIDGVRVNLDQSVLETSWNEIDAVELVGYP